MQTESRYLFVYGTLMSGAQVALGKAQRMRLARESDSLGPASIAHARLYDLGRYPGAVAGGGVDDLVHGEAVVLSDPERTLAWLDAYEGIVPGKHDANEYERTLREVKLAGGEAIDTWVYLLRAVTAHARRIEDGRWMPRRGRASH
jgi:gamma-glutamylcyclotransferase (GGCT)/AIG2-like uncharacterized protein YtfP